ncbi:MULTISPECIES: hypothetical protein [Flavobacteriaceae]|uniref:Anti-sigma factor n=2 Tax=Flavobacteriaceae TaxID=49546 RepID=A0A4Y8AWF9_9FLAO|nr:MULTISPECIES: hypothetical protein [Flavobacteriaceae]TEW76847.1 hypothetical protein E2488_03085 [Gramella jeungdoensis]GGK49524.1 hypothetical protein GCM10007963_17350 [Lutibacter litoralis]
MSKDLREVLKKKPIGSEKLSKNHRRNFEAKLKNEMHTSRNKNYQFLKTAASFLILIGLGTSMFYILNSTKDIPVETARIKSLGSISPEFRNIENYYLASIQAEISDLNKTSENKELLDSYLEKISELSLDYKQLTNKLSAEGLNEKNINALIENLQLRLKLMYQLKEQLNDLKNLNNSENENISI